MHADRRMKAIRRNAIRCAVFGCGILTIINDFTSSHLFINHKKNEYSYLHIVVEPVYSDLSPPFQVLVLDVVVFPAHSLPFGMVKVVFGVETDAIIALACVFSLLSVKSMQDIAKSGPQAGF
jgi:hypothetical protein